MGIFHDGSRYNRELFWNCGLGVKLWGILNSRVMLPLRRIALGE